VVTGLKAVAAMMEAEVNELAGPRGKHDPDRAVGRRGSARTSVRFYRASTAALRPSPH
jgi:hypothetical protein